MPGVFILSRGRIIKAHRHRDASDRVDDCDFASGVEDAPPERLAINT